MSPAWRADLGRDGIAEQHQWKCEAWQGVVAKVCHDGGGSESGTHLWKTESCVLGDERKITDDCESKAESKSVALNLGNTDQGRRSQ